MLRTTLATTLALAIAGCATTPLPAADGGQPRATVTRDGAIWTVDYDLALDSPVWAFFRSALERTGREPWRPKQWVVETPGVALERHGHMDVFRSTNGGPVPRHVRVSLAPAAADLEADYDPALIFTDGSVALYSGHFDLFPLPSVEAAAALPLDLGEAEVNGHNAMITWRDRAGPVLQQGERRLNPTSDQAGQYVLFGQAALVDSPKLATVIDPQLPGWISAAIADFAPRIADYYTERLGPGQTAKPTVMISWNGPTSGLRSMGGSVLPGLIVMTFEGERVVEPSKPLADQARWFIGHESAHFWLGQTVHYEFSRDAWITEGGADLMAIRALNRIDPVYDARTALQEEVDDCISLADEPVAAANTRGEHRAYYACGAVFALAAEAAWKRKSGGDWFDALKLLIDGNREDGVVTREEWLAAMTDPAVRGEIEGLLDKGSPDAGAAIARIFNQTGVPYRLDDGKPVLL